MTETKSKTADHKDDKSAAKKVAEKAADKVKAADDKVAAQELQPEANQQRPDGSDGRDDNDGKGPHPQETTDEVVHTQTDDVTVVPGPGDTRYNDDLTADDDGTRINAVEPYQRPSEPDPVDTELRPEPNSDVARSIAPVTTDVHGNDIYDPVGAFVAREEAGLNSRAEKPVPSPVIAEGESDRITTFMAAHPGLAVIPPSLLPASYQDPTRATPGFPPGVAEPGGERKPLSLD